MKKLFYTLALTFVGLAFTQAQEITFEEEVINYGDVLKGEDGKRTFSFTNTGEAPLLIKSVKPSCGCTVAEYPKEPVAPGESGEIIVGYDTNRMNAFSKTIEVHSNALESGRKVLRIKGRVIEE